MSDKHPRRNEASQEERQAAPETGSPLEPDANVGPLFDDPARAEKWETQKETLQLPKRDDATRLLLFADEIATWLPTVAKRVAELEIPMPDGEIVWDPANIQRVTRVFAETGWEMGPVIFTPERLKILITRLRRYRNERRKEGEQEAAQLADVALEMLKTPEETLAQAFMAMVCMASLQWVTRKMGEERAEAREAEGKE